MGRLIKEGGPNVQELGVLRRWLKDEARKGRERQMISIEYEFDDGAAAQGRGDCVLKEVWSGRVVVLEVKRIPKTAPFTHAFRKVACVRSQASRYARRLESWLRHMHAANECGQGSSHAVVAATLVLDERGKPAVYEELPWAAPRRSCSGVVSAAGSSPPEGVEVTGK